jgi:hypothetical protein
MGPPDAAEPGDADPLSVVTATRQAVAVLWLPGSAALAARADVPPPAPAPRPAAEPPPLDLLAAADPHDAFFRVGRCDADGLAGHHHGVQAALALLDDESRTDGPPSATVLALRRTLLALGQPADLSPLALALPPADPQAERRLALSVQRWVRGHQIFAVLTQGLLLAVQALQRAAQAAPAAPLDAHLRRLADLYIASALAMRFTADFPQRHYERAIRPAMSEPHAPAGFSGALSSDHAQLVAVLVQARPALERAAAAHPDMHRQVKQALAAMYEDHKRVCDRLASLAQPSIRSASLTQQSHASGELLDRFRDRRSVLLR